MTAPRSFNRTPFSHLRQIAAQARTTSFAHPSLRLDAKPKEPSSSLVQRRVEDRRYLQTETTCQTIETALKLPEVSDECQSAIPTPADFLFVDLFRSIVADLGPSDAGWNTLLPDFSDSVSANFEWTCGAAALVGCHATLTPN